LYKKNLIFLQSKFDSSKFCWFSKTKSASIKYVILCKLRSFSCCVLSYIWFFLIGRSDKKIESKVQPSIMPTPLVFTAFCISLLFISFEIYLIQVFVRTIYDFVQNFKRYLFIKRCFNQRDNRGELSKIQTVQFILGHPLVIRLCHYKSKD